MSRLGSGDLSSVTSTEGSLTKGLSVLTPDGIPSGGCSTNFSVLTPDGLPSDTIWLVPVSCTKASLLEGSDNLSESSIFKGLSFNVSTGAGILSTVILSGSSGSVTNVFPSALLSNISSVGDL